MRAASVIESVTPSPWGRSLPTSGFHTRGGQERSLPGSGLQGSVGGRACVRAGARTQCRPLPLPLPATRSTQRVEWMPGRHCCPLSSPPSAAAGADLQCEWHRSHTRRAAPNRVAHRPRARASCWWCYPACCRCTLEYASDAHTHSCSCAWLPPTPTRGAHMRATAAAARRQPKAPPCAPRCSTTILPVCAPGHCTAPRVPCPPPHALMARMSLGAALIVLACLAGAARGEEGLPNSGRKLLGARQPREGRDLRVVPVVAGALGRGPRGLASPATPLPTHRAGGAWACGMARSQH